MNDDDCDLTRSLTQRLHDAVPPAPEVSGWAGRAAASARRAGAARSALLAGAVALAVVAGVVTWTLRPSVGGVLASPAPPTQLSVDPADPEKPTSPPTPSLPTEPKHPTQPPSTAGCPDNLEPDLPAQGVPAGAIALRICPAGAPELMLIPPNDELTTGLDEVIAKINALPAGGPDQVCTSEMGPAYRLVFTYRGRTPVVVDGQLYGCRILGSPQRFRNGADKILTELVDRWTKQRAAQGESAPPPRPNPWCLGGPYVGSVMPVAVTNAVAAHACVYDQTTSVTARVERTLSAAQFGVVRADLNARVRSVSQTCDLAPKSIVVANLYGDLLSLRGSTCGRWYFTSENDTREWDPGPAAQAILERLTTK